MSKYQKLKEHLPSLYRPEDRETNLLNLLLKELGGNMDEISRELTVVMQSHWFKTADKATYDNHFLRARELAGLGVVQLHDANDREAIAEYPYLLDLARVGALLSIPPRREPIALRETVEEYRVRLLRIVNIYRNGLGTLEAIRNMVTAELPENHDLDLAAQQRSFSVEENIPYTGPIKVIESIGLPLETVGPLMR
ncbi:MAG: hypothetical protein JKY24_03430, partial [Pseudomonadales bacterium]|nr:hypothetical protein [Pseudomonadales bacterium]